MAVVLVQLAAALGFVAWSAVAGAALARDQRPDAAERISRGVQFAFYALLVAPMAVGFAFPGGDAFDALLGLPELPVPAPWRYLAAAALFAVGGYFSVASNQGLAQRGKGTLAFKLTSHVVSEGVYSRVRNPMAVGYYLGTIAFAFAFGSTYLLLYSLLAVIPAHVFYLKVFEERELAARYGDSYRKYAAETPFLIPRLKPKRSA